MKSNIKVEALRFWGFPVLVSVGLAAVWIFLAWPNPSSTHHFAPLLISGSVGFTAHLKDKATTLIAAAVGSGVAVTALVTLGVSNRLLGPTLWHSQPSWPELLGFAVLGGILTTIRGIRQTSATA